jgi:hypothetical protein
LRAKVLGLVYGFRCSRGRKLRQSEQCMSDKPGCDVDR